jgi:D,D-heptose 1,7-bisphosphate phosphatase
VFLDRDGTINVDPGFLSDPEHVRLFPGVPEALARLKALGLRLVVISNQSGIGRGLVTREALARVNRRIFELARVVPDRIYNCPHHPSEGRGWYRRRCDCRKPATGMVERGLRHLGLDVVASFLIGDSGADVECGLAAGLTTVLVRTGNGDETFALVEAGRLPRPHHVAKSLADAAEFIASRVSRGPAALTSGSG